MFCTIVAEFLLTSTLRSPSAIAEPLVTTLLASVTYLDLLAVADHQLLNALLSLGLIVMCA